MKVTLEQLMYAPSNRMQYGGTNPAIFKRTTKLNLTPLILVGILSSVQIFSFDGYAWQMRGYDALTNVLSVRGGLKTGSKRELKDLVKKKWKFFPEAAKQYGFSLVVTNDKPPKSKKKK